MAYVRSGGAQYLVDREPATKYKDACMSDSSDCAQSMAEQQRQLVKIAMSMREDRGKREEKEWTNRGEKG
eukprot:684427-Rhodomonas_salina.2